MEGSGSCVPPATLVPGKRSDRAVLRTPGQRLLSHHHVRALSPLPWGGSRTHWRGSRDRPCWGAHVTAPKRGLGWGSRFPRPGRLQGTVGTPDPGHSLEVLGSQPIPEHTQHSTAQLCQCQGCQGNQIPAPAEAAEHPQLGVSLLLLGRAWCIHSSLQPQEDSSARLTAKAWPPLLG